MTSRTNGGNLAYSYSYDDENQLISVVYQDPAVANSSWWRSDFVYDGRGRLRQRQDYTWYGGTPPGWITGPAICYIYDGMRVIQERDAFNTPTVSYTRGSDLSGTLEGAGGIGGLLARSHGYSSGSWTNHNFYHADGNGNITYLVNSSQSIAASYRYDPFGNPVSSSGTLASANTYRFSSKERHPNSGMYYYGYRWYDPNLQRWPNRDPLGEPGFETTRRGRSIVLGTGPNLYTFVLNNPVRSIDPEGLIPDGAIPPPYGCRWNRQKENKCVEDANNRFKDCLKWVRKNFKNGMDEISDTHEDCEFRCLGIGSVAGKIACIAACNAVFLAEVSVLNSFTAGGLAGCALQWHADVAACPNSSFDIDLPH